MTNAKTSCTMDISKQCRIVQEVLLCPKEGKTCSSYWTLHAAARPSRNNYCSYCRLLCKYLLRQEYVIFKTRPFKHFSHLSMYVLVFPSPNWQVIQDASWEMPTELQRMILKQTIIRRKQTWQIEANF